MDAGLLEAVISRNQPFKIETASGRILEVRHRDFVSLSPKRTSLSVFYEENGEEHLAIVPVAIVTAVSMQT